MGVFFISTWSIRWKYRRKKTGRKEGGASKLDIIYKLFEITVLGRYKDNLLIPFIEIFLNFQN